MILLSSHTLGKVRGFLLPDHLVEKGFFNLMSIRLISEFAAVEIARDDQGNGPRLRIRDLQTDQEIYLDPLELAALAWSRHEELLPLLNPGRFERQDGT